MRRNRRFIVLVLAGLLAATSLAACGDDDEEGDDNGNGDAAANVEEYCDRVLAIETVDEPDIDFESLSEEEQKKAAQDFARDSLRPLADDVVKVAPAEIEDDITVLSGAVDKIVETGNFNIFEEDEAVKAAETRVHAYDLENCDWGKVATTAVEYAFQGVPATVPAGATSFDLTNGGKELHEMIVFRKNDGVTMSFDELLALDQEEAQKNVSNVVANFAPPGGADYGVAELTPGQYVMVCFVSVGSTPDNEEADGPPHFTQGMKAEFTVT